MITLTEARALSEKLLKVELPKRWRHSLGVFRQAQLLAPTLGDQAEVIAISAILHDVGYSSAAVDTGQHMIDGARYLRALPDVDPLVCSIVAYHSSSRWESAELGLSHALAEFPPPPQLLEDAITYCDLSTSPDGDLVDPASRLEEVLRRYGPDEVVHRAVSAARPDLLGSVARVASLLEAQTV